MNKLSIVKDQGRAKNIGSNSPLSFLQRFFLLAGASFNWAGRAIQHLGGNFPNGSSESILRERMLENGVVAFLNRLAPSVGERHPNMLVVICMDPRISSRDLFLDHRDGMIDTLRLPGSAPTKAALETARLAIEAHHVKLVLWTRHTDCAMERVANDPAISSRYPELRDAVRNYAGILRDFLNSAPIASRCRSGDLQFHFGIIDTKTGRISPDPEFLEDREAQDSLGLCGGAGI